MNLFKRFTDPQFKELRRFNKIADEIVKLDEEFSKKTDEELRGYTESFKERLENNETLDDILVEAFAVAREAAYRCIGEKPYHVQLVGGIAIHEGNIAEMKTGEGKTLTTILPAYLNALSGKGVHVVTTNEYLSSRNAEWMEPIYTFLGVTVGINERELSPQEKREEYLKDITYSTNNEIGFDYLRDNMVITKDDRVLRPLNFVIIDEVDSILIDEARTPLIISGAEAPSDALYMKADTIVKSLKNKEDYELDEKSKTVILTDKGSDKVEKHFSLKNLYDAENTNIVHFVNQSLKANYGMDRNVDYVVEDDKVIIVDQFTGRLMHGRQFSDGLHQAIEAKENVTINEETKTMATITFQNLFRMYNKLSGMTGTAKTEEEEFREIYNMFVIEIPTNKPLARIDSQDMMFATAEGKYNKIIEFIKEVNEKGQPILVGTISVESNEHLSSLLKKHNLKHEILNAKNHEREAEIIENAGEKGAITIATNMAGRGTDIKLGEGVVELGGLCVIGTERHESRRIDNQLRGRAGRQGDPGFSQFFISFEDELMRRFGTDKVKEMIQNLGYDETQPLQSKMFSRSIETAQKKVEGNNYDMRKSLLDYDNVVSEQRNIIYERRNNILDNDNLDDDILITFEEYVANIVLPYEITNRTEKEDYIKIKDFFNKNILLNKKLTDEDIINKGEEEIISKISTLMFDSYKNKIGKAPQELVLNYERYINLKTIDDAWVNHITAMDHLRDGISLRGYGQTNPLQAYALEGFEIFDEMLATIDENITNFLMKVEIKETTKVPELKQEKINTNEGEEESPKQNPIVNKKKVGRNEPCPCGSGKKYKHCHGK